MIEDKNQKKTTLSELGEFGLIEHLTAHFSIIRISGVVLRVSNNLHLVLAIKEFK